MNGPDIGITEADQPDRIIRLKVECAHENHDDHADWPCGWSGTADVSVFEDTQEAIWWCPDEHENYVPWGEL